MWVKAPVTCGFEMRSHIYKKNVKPALLPVPHSKGLRIARQV